MGLFRRGSNSRRSSKDKGSKIATKAAAPEQLVDDVTPDDRRTTDNGWPSLKSKSAPAKQDAVPVAVANATEAPTPRTVRTNIAMAKADQAISKANAAMAMAEKEGERANAAEEELKRKELEAAQAKAHAAEEGKARLEAEARAAAAEQMNSSASTTPEQVFVWPEGGNEVFLVGSFTNWADGKITMEKKGDDFVAALPLDQGEHTYKFIVDGDWKTCSSLALVSDGAGNQNHVIFA